MNKFCKKGWKQLNCNINGLKLPGKHGHVMIEYNDFINVFGGTSIEFGGVVFSSIEKEF